MNRRSIFKMFLMCGIALAVIPAVSGIETRRAAVSAGVVRQANARTVLSDSASRSSQQYKARIQDDRYDRRREYWEQRIERRMEEEESRDGGDEEANDKDSKKAKDKGDDDEDDASADQPAQREHDAVEQRREYWRNRLEREW